MLVRFNIYFFFLILMIFSGNTNLYAQGFKGIMPLESTCDDVKRILQVETCTFPQSTYFLKDFWVTVNYEKEQPSEKDTLCYKVPAGTVTSLTVSYNKRFPIKDFEYELKFVEKLSNDIDTVVYENAQKGVGVYVHLGVITDAMFGPTPEQHKKFAYECKSGCKN